MSGVEIALLIVVSIATLVLLVLMIIAIVGILKLLKTIQRIAEIAQDGTKTAADIVHEVKEKIINPVTMTAIFAKIMSQGKGKK